MNLTELSFANKDSYNHFVAAQKSGSFLQAWEWGDWQKVLGNAPRRFAWVGSDGNWLAALQTLNMPLPLGKHYLYAPYGPVSAVTDLDIANLSAQILKIDPQAVFLRLEPQTQISGL